MPAENWQNIIFWLYLFYDSAIQGQFFSGSKQKQHHIQTFYVYIVYGEKENKFIAIHTSVFLPHCAPLIVNVKNKGKRNILARRKN